MLKPEHLITLREVMRLGSFAKAANRLGYTASAVSQQISALERETGVQLFHRTARAVVPTEAAGTVARHSVTVLAEIDRLLVAAGQAKRKSGEVMRIGTFPSFSMLVLPHLLRALDPAGRRGLRLLVGEPSQLIPSLGSGGDLAAAIVYQVGQAGLSWPSSLRRHWIAEDPFVIAYPRSWPNRPTPPYPAEQFVDLPWVLNIRGTGDATVLEGLFSRWDLHPRVVAHCDDFNATMSLVAAGLGAAPLPRIALSAGVPRDMEVIEAPWLNISRSIMALVQPDRSTPALTALLDSLSRLVQDLQLGAGATPLAPA